MTEEVNARRADQTQKVTLRIGDCIEVMASVESNSVDFLISDPPYG